ncbi:hypothetical protein TIFTF001_007422 [Ficus carica]|uniref:Uncharacterized protein n=1 Tax=Ficus carica TaxID=3494 RepID=A0AA88CX39_FICCA|nr:hypothetical protein TIFTF001_007422 [Ficus carica]
MVTTRDLGLDDTIMEGDGRYDVRAVALVGAKKMEIQV